MSVVSSPLKWHGGKSYLAKQIVALMPPHLTYCEPFFGGGSVLLAKDPEGISEVANDLNGALMNFWATLSNQNTFHQFKRWVEATPFSERCFELSQHSDYVADPNSIDPSAAVAFFVRCRQSLAGRMDSFAPLSRTRTRRGMNEQVSAWLSAVEGLPVVHSRLKRVAVTNRPAVKVIKDLDRKDTLFYCDPPYVKETRAAKEVYQHEMSHSDHEELLEALLQIDGKFILSGYPSDLYNRYRMLGNWFTREIEIDNKAASGATKRKMTECLWMNFKPAN